MQSKQRKRYFSVFSYIEIYNEQVRDLLRTTRPASKKQETLKVREHPKEGPFVQGKSLLLQPSVVLYDFNIKLKS